MKKGLVILLMVLLAASLFASGAQEKGAKQDGIVIGWSNAGMGDSWRQFLQSNFLAEVDAHPEITDYYITNADEKPEKQIADIQDLIAKGIGRTYRIPDYRGGFRARDRSGI